MHGKNQLIENIIQQAQKDGKFENLKGKGKPLQIQQKPFVDPEWQLAFDILQKDGFVLPWIDKYNEIENRLKAAREQYQRTDRWARSTETPNPETIKFVENELHVARKKFFDAIESINQLIAAYNLEIPSSRFFRMKVDAQLELKNLANEQHDTEKI